MRLLWAACLLAAAGCVAAAKCSIPGSLPDQYPFWGFNQYQDLRYSQRARTYFAAEGHKRCPGFPVYMHDMASAVYARHNTMCVNDGDDALFYFTTKDPCRGGKEVNGTLFVGRLPRICPSKEIQGKSWDQTEGQVWIDPAQMPAVRCPAGYRVAGPRDLPALRAVLSSYFLVPSKAGVQLDRYDSRIYCHDAFRVIYYNSVTGCVQSKPTVRPSGTTTAVIAQAEVEFACYGQFKKKTIGLRTPGSYTMQCPRTIRFQW
ncbi:hypothetical protein ABPG75_008687 [Micractinium tetrahymenae]